MINKVPNEMLLVKTTPRGEKQKGCGGHGLLHLLHATRLCVRRGTGHAMFTGLNGMQFYMRIRGR